jgi:CubicO group peptidase (beta-lactamase class C family)
MEMGKHPMIRTTCLLLTLGLAFAPLRSSAQEQSPARLSATLASAVDSAVAAEMKKQQAVGVAIGILQQGKIVYLKGYGLADREKETPVTTDTVFNWASNSKPLAAVAAMQLVDKELLDLDADVRTYVPEFPDKGAVITTRHLLTHQSGIPHYSNGPVLETTREYEDKLPFLDPVLALDKFNRSSLIFQPGEKNEYSSYAFILLSAVIQRAGKEPFDKQVQERIGKPLDMKSLQLDFETKDQPHWATGYKKSLTRQVIRAPEDANYWKHGAGGYKSNIGDFAKWTEAILNHRVVSTDAEKQMFTAHKLKDGKPTTRGLGFIVEENGLKVSHNGGQPETATRMVLYPEAKHGVVVMCNCQFVNPSAISTAIYAALNEKQ